MTHERDLFAQAMDLLIALDRRVNDPQARAQIDQWCAQGPDHRAMWREVLEIDGMAGAVLSVDPAPGPSRRNLLLGGLAVGVGGTLGGVTLPGALRWLRADFATARAEILPVSLPDGSSLTLGPRSTVALDFAPGRRRVDLSAGMALLSVRPPHSDTEGPLEIALPDLRLTTRQAEFDLSRDAGEISLAVLSGDMTVAGAAKPIVLSQGHRLGIGADGAARVTDLPVDQMGLWRQGQIMADDETVAAMVAKVARWQPGRVLVTDRDLGARRVSGLYTLRDPVQALRAIVGPYGGRVRQISALLTLVSAA